MRFARCNNGHLRDAMAARRAISRRPAVGAEDARLDRRSTARFAKLVTGEWIIDRTSAKQRRILHYWLTIVWFTVGLVVWIALRHALWFVGFMSLYAIWITHLAGWAAETPVEEQDAHGTGPERTDPG